MTVINEVLNEILEYGPYMLPRNNSSRGTMRGGPGRGFKPHSTVYGHSPRFYVYVVDTDANKLVGLYSLFDPMGEKADRIDEFVEKCIEDGKKAGHKYIAKVLKTANGVKKALTKLGITPPENVDRAAADMPI